MPQLNPTQWFFTLYTTWIIFFALFYLITKTPAPMPPTKLSNITTPRPWEWP